MSEQTAPDIQAEIRRAAKSVAFQWPGTIGPDDAEQEIWLRLLQSEGSMSKLQGMTDRQRYNALVGIGHQVAAQYRDSYDRFSGNYRYAVDEVRDLLESGTMTEARVSIKAERTDMDEAFELLQRANTSYVGILRQNFVLGAYDKSTGSARMALTRAVDKLTDLMNQVYRNRKADYAEGPGTRRPITNAHAQAITSKKWSE